MPNPYFQFKQFTVHHDRCAMKVTTDACLFGAWAADRSRESGTGRLLDIGTGSGLLALMMAQQLAVRIDAVEIDGEAARQAAENVAASPWAGKIDVHASDIRQFPPSGYDLILSNPPFYETDLPSTDERRNFAHHGTALPLAALAEVINEKLAPSGRFFLLLPVRREAEAMELLEDQGLSLEEVVHVRQSQRHGPFRILLRGTRTSSVTRFSEIVIADATGGYTPEFTALLRPYYLYL